MHSLDRDVWVVTLSCHGLKQLKPLSVAAITAESLLHESPGGLGASLPKCLIVGQVQEGVHRLIGIIAHLGPFRSSSSRPEDQGRVG